MGKGVLAFLGGIIGAAILAMLWGAATGDRRTAAPLAAADTLASGCSVHFERGLVVAVLCPSGLSGQDLRTVGRRACAGREACNAWIWDDSRDLPASVPMSDQAVERVYAVWMNKPQRLDCKRGCP